MILRVLFDGLWEGAAIVAIAYLVNCCVPQRNATTRYAVWFVTLLALLVIPVLTVVSNAGALLLAAVQPHAAIAEHTWKISLFPAQPLVNGATGFFTPALRWIPAFWLFGAGVCLARLGASLVRIGRIRKGAVPSQTESDVLISAGVAIPIAVGFRNPAIIIPKTLFETLAPADLDRVIAHERAHLRRQDVPGNLVQRLVEAILFFNPCPFCRPQFNAGTRSRMRRLGSSKNRRPWRVCGLPGNACTACLPDAGADCNAERAGIAPRVGRAHRAARRQRAAWTHRQLFHHRGNRYDFCTADARTRGVLTGPRLSSGYVRLCAGRNGLGRRGSLRETQRGREGYRARRTTNAARIKGWRIGHPRRHDRAQRKRHRLKPAQVER